MSTTIETGATPNATETVTVTPPQGNQGATPKPQFDSAARIAELEASEASSKSHIKALNDESKTHRLAKERAESELQSERAKFEDEKAKLAEILKHGTPAEILAAIQERDALKTAQQEAEAKAQRDTTLQGVAVAAEVNLDALKALDSAGLQYEVKEEKNGKKVTVNGKPFDEHFALFLPSLRPAKAPAPGARPTPQPAPGSQLPATPRRPPGAF